MNRMQREKEQHALEQLQRGHLEDAEAIYRTLMEEGATSYTIFYNLAVICGMQGRKQEMIPLLRKAITINPNDPEVYNNLGVALKDKGDLQAAIDSYRQSLAIKSHSPQVYSNLGNALKEQGNLQAAIDAYRQALAISSNSSQVYFNLGNALKEQGNFQAAIDAYRQALVINPNLLKVYSNLGNALKDQGDPQAAIDAYHQALAINPNSPEVYNNLGNALKKQDDFQAAINAYRQALDIKPDYAEAYTNLGIALIEQGDLQAAVDAYRQVLAIQPHSPKAYFNLGMALKSQGDLQAAIDAYRQALAINPNDPQAYNNLGIALKGQGNLQAAIDAYRQALAIKPHYPEVYNNLGNALKDQGDLKVAIDAYRQALAINSDYPAAHCNLSLVQLLLSDYESGWKEYEWRFQVKGNPQPHAHPQVERWNGSNLAPGENLILVSEQGLGDTLQFMRYVLYLNNIGISAALCAKTKLHSLIRASEITTMIYSPEQVNQRTTGKWLPLLSLPGYLQVRPDHPIVNPPYIKAPEQQVDHWRQKLATEQRPIVGINWSGTRRPAPSGKTEDWRSLPLEAFAPIVEKTTVTLLSLQKGDGSEQLANCSFRHRFVSCQEDINQTWDFVETAAIVANCDLIITSDTAVAHLAAGMGHPTWLLLTQMPEWRWGMEGESSFWYPSMRLFRQRERGNWTEVMERVATALAALLSHPKEAMPQYGAECPERVAGSSAGQPSAMNSMQQEKERHALEHLQNGHLEEAEVIYRTLIEEGAVSPTVFGNLAVICGRQGRTQEIIPLLKKSIAVKPNYPEAYSNLGNALKNQGNLQAAIDAYRQALVINPNLSDAYFNLGNALKEQDNLQAAIDAYRQALATKPNYPEAYLNLGNALKEQGNLQAAIDAYRQALAINPNLPGAYFNLGIALKEQGNLQAAIDAYRQALAINPNLPGAYFNLGIALKEQGNLQAAIDAYRQALAINPNLPYAYFNLGIALKEQGNLQAAIDAYRQALAINPNLPGAYFNLGIALKEQGNLQAAIDAYRQALAINPNLPYVHCNLGNALQEKGNLQAAIDAYRQALAINPDYPDAHFNLSLVKLLSGDYKSGWKEYEWRFQIKDNTQPHAHPQVEQWTGSNLAPGESLILVSEQGLGDTLQFMRYVLYLNNIGQSAALCAQTNLHGLIRTSGITTVIYSPEQANQLTTGKWLPLLSLPGYLQVRPDHPIIDTPYIKAPAQQVDHWRQKLAAEQRPIIGINWSGNPKPEKGSLRGRSLPLEAFAPIVEQTSVTLLSLQKGDGSEQLADCSFRHRFVGCQEDINQTWDFVETAAMIANCHLIITSDTAVAHLAAGMGHPTWLLLTQMPDWRWGREGERSFWYPSMRLFRQRERGNWTEVMERVATALAALLSHPKGTSYQDEKECPERVAGSSAGQPSAMNRMQREREQQALEQLQQGHLEEAEVIYRALIEEGAVSPTVFGNLAAICGRQGRTQETILLLRKAVDINPNYPQAYSNLGNALQEQGNLQAAIDCYRQALAINPNYPNAYYNLGNALKEQGDLQAAIDAYRQALAINPSLPYAHCNLSVVQLLLGDYENGWKEYEWRFQVKSNPQPHAHPQVEQWNGSNLAPGESLILVSEQGLGDTLHFMRYVLYLNNTGQSATLCASTKLHDLIRASGITTVIYSPEQANQLTTGKWLPLLSLPGYLQVRPDHPIVDTPYIKAPEQQVDHWRQKLAAEQHPIIGINWSGNPKAEKGSLRGRSLPLESFMPIVEQTTVTLLSLQKGDGSEQLADCSFRHRFVGCQKDINQTWDFVETAAMIANCRLIITSDTAVAHLAAGMGHPTWLLLTQMPDWRWGVEGERSFWYPSLRLFRQRERGNWTEVMERVATALAALLSHPKEAMPQYGAECPERVAGSSAGQPSAMNRMQREREQRALEQLQQGRLEEAEVIYRTLIEEGAVSPTVFGNLAAICGMQGRTQESIPLLKRAIAINPNYADAYNNLGIVLQEQGDLQAAIGCYRQALAINPHLPDVYNNLGIVLKEQGDLQIAIDAYRQALVIQPNYSEAYFNLGNALQRQDNLQVAIDAYRQALAIKPNYPEAHYNLSYVQLLSGDYESGWKEYEWRFRARDNRELLYAQPQIERWTGSNLAPGESLILVSEQGLGDTLQFMRYVLYLNNTGRSAALCTSAKLHALIQSSGITTMIYSSEQANQLTTGKWLPLLSLPGYLQVCPDHPIVDAPYIKAPEQQVAHWRQKLAAEQQSIIGINWSGNLKIEKESLRGRSLPLEAFAPIVEQTTVTLLSLQKGDGSEQLADCSFRHRFVGCQKDINQTWDFVETAAIIANCRLIITSDTAVAHLAAGMGHPTWLLLTQMPDWRWGREGERSFWYPSLRLFRQRERGNWTEVMERVATALEALLSHPKETNHQDGTERPKRVAGSSSGQPGAMNRMQREREQHALEQLQQGHLEEAKVIYRALIEEGAISPTVLGNLAAICGRQGRTQEMILLLRKAITINPNDPAAYSNLGDALQGQGDLQAAIDTYRQALSIKPDYPQVYNNLGIALKEQGDLQTAIDVYRQALVVKPNYPQAYNNLGNALKEQGNLQAAIDAYRQALAINPNLPDAYLNLGNALREQDNLQAAIDAYRQALVVNPNYLDAYCNFGFVLIEQGDLQAAINIYRQALTINANSPEAHFNLSVAQLLSGDYESGWKEYEWRFQMKRNLQPQAHPQVERWNGSNLAPGENLILVSEQGLGDTLQFMRYVLYLNNTGRPAALCAQTKLHDLIRASGITTVIYSPEQANQLTTGKWFPLLSLPGYLQVRPDHPIIDTPYIKAPEQQVDHWRQKLAAEQRPIIGINWSGTWRPTPSGKKEDWRSLPLEAFAPIVEKTTVTLLSLQKGDGSKQLADCSFRHRFVGCQKDINQTWDFVETAAMIANCRLIITSDTAVAHLAAGMGHPTWLLLTQMPEWRWGREGERSFWYPSLRLFRQRERGNWTEVMERVATALAALLSHPEETSHQDLIEHPKRGAGSSSGQPGAMNRVQQKKEQQALEQLQQGHLEEAEVIYRALIEEGAISPTVLGNLAAICGRQGRTQETILLLRKAVDINPNYPQAYSNLGNALQEQGNLQAAIDCYRQALAINPNYPNAYYNLGNALKEQGNLQAAIDAYRQALAINPSLPYAHCNLGNALKEQGDLQAAIDAYRQALAINPSLPYAHCNLGNALKEQGDLQAAIDAYRQALAINPSLPYAHCNLGNALKEQGDLQAAIDAYRQALAINPSLPYAHCNLGNALKEQGDLQAAIDAYRQALAINPSLPYAHCNLGNALKEQGDLQAAIDAYRQALAINPDYPEAHCNLSLVQLLSGDYENGWKGYEWRFQVKDNPQPHTHPKVERWNGSNLTSGESLILVSEQGLGDTLQFMRYILYLNNTGRPAALCAQTKLHDLIRASGITTVIYSPEQANQLTTGKWFPLLSLPGYLQVRPDHPIIDTPYIKAPEQQVDHWRQKLAAEQRPSH